MLAGWPWLFPRFLALVRKLFGAPDVFSAVAVRWLLYLPQACFV
ncbi:hypothetical protein R75461_03284 [Paraburkholderia nemoris]|nr:hypothetical protein R75461_03284 [Paraburkholderia nemoris]